MSDEKPDKPEKPDPIDDVRKGLGLLFRAAKGALDQLPTRRVEDVVLTGAREVGRAIENVTDVIDKQLFKRDPHAPGDNPPPGEATDTSGETKPESTKTPEEPKGPRVG